MDRQTKSCATLLQRRCCGNTLLLSYPLPFILYSLSSLSPLLLSAILTLNFHLSTLYSLSLSSLYPPIYSPLLSFCSPLSSTPHSLHPLLFLLYTPHSPPLLLPLNSNLSTPPSSSYPSLYFTLLYFSPLHWLHCLRSCPRLHSVPAFLLSSLGSPLFFTFHALNPVSKIKNVLEKMFFSKSTTLPLWTHITFKAQNLTQPFL